MGKIKGFLGTKIGKIVAVIVVILVIGAILPSKEGSLSFVVEQGDWDSSVASTVVLKVAGEAEDGSAINEKYEAEPGKTYSLEYKKGKYSFCVADESIVVGDKIFKKQTQSVTFDGKNDKTVTIKMELDQSAMKSKADEGEARLAAERAAANASAQSGSNAQSNASSSSSDNGGMTVYITPTGSKYHYDGCRMIKGSKTAVTLDEAKSRGLTACGVCHPPA